MRLTQYGQVLALQRSAGNRAVAPTGPSQMIAPGSGTVLARDMDLQVRTLRHGERLHR